MSERLPYEVFAASASAASADESEDMTVRVQDWHAKRHRITELQDEVLKLSRKVGSLTGYLDALLRAAPPCPQAPDGDLCDDRTCAILRKYEQQK